MQDKELFLMDLIDRYFAEQKFYQDLKFKHGRCSDQKAKVASYARQVKQYVKLRRLEKKKESEQPEPALPVQPKLF